MEFSPTGFVLTLLFEFDIIVWFTKKIYIYIYIYTHTHTPSLYIEF